MSKKKPSAPKHRKYNPTVDIAGEILRYNPKLAAKLKSVNGAIVLYQFMYKWSISENYFAGHYWFYDTVMKIKNEVFPHFSTENVRKILKSLVSKEYVVQRKIPYFKNSNHQTWCYTINFEKLKELQSLEILDQRIDKKYTDNGHDPYSRKDPSTLPNYGWKDPSKLSNCRLEDDEPELESDQLELGSDQLELGSLTKGVTSTDSLKTSFRFLHKTNPPDAGAEHKGAAPHQATGGEETDATKGIINLWFSLLPNPSDEECEVNPESIKQYINSDVLSIRIAIGNYMSELRSNNAKRYSLVEFLESEYKKFLS
jgi:hypothetical protein